MRIELLLYFCEEDVNPQSKSKAADELAAKQS